MDYNKKDIPAFIDEVCKKKCNCWDFGDSHGCAYRLDNQDWFLMCGKYFNWKLGIKSCIEVEEDFYKEHPDILERRKREHEEYLQRIEAEKEAKKKAKEDKKKEKEAAKKKKETTKKAKKK